MRPTIQQLDNWCCFHLINSSRTLFGVEMLAYGKDHDILARVLIEEPVEAFNSEEDVSRYNRACSQIAYELCIVPPQVALALNHQSYRQ